MHCTSRADMKMCTRGQYSTNGAGFGLWTFFLKPRNRICKFIMGMRLAGTYTEDISWLFGLESVEL